MAYGEIRTGVWVRNDWYEFDEEPEEWYDEDNDEWVYPYWDRETETWVNLSPWDDPADYQPRYTYAQRFTGSVEWHAQSDAERRVMKFIN